MNAILNTFADNGSASSLPTAYVNVAEAARMKGVSTYAVVRAIRKGQLPAKLANADSARAHYRVPLSEVVAWQAPAPRPKRAKLPKLPIITIAEEPEVTLSMVEELRALRVAVEEQTILLRQLVEAFA